MDFYVTNMVLHILNVKLLLSGGKLKTWRKKWFVLKNGVLTYYKSQSDINRKPQGQIMLDEICKITRAEGSNTFEIDTGKKTYYLTADTITAMEDWVRIIELKLFLRRLIVACRIRVVLQSGSFSRSHSKVYLYFHPSTYYNISRMDYIVQNCNSSDYHDCQYF